MVAITAENLGAWVFKCNPNSWDLPAWIADGNDWVDNWSVVANYRSDMPAPRDRAILWVSGRQQAHGARHLGSGVRHRLRA